MVKMGLQFRSGREQTCVKVQTMGVKIGVCRAGTGPFGSQFKPMVIKHGIYSDRSIYMVVCIGNCGVLLNCSGETEPTSTHD
jgi:hypothetical protein